MAVDLEAELAEFMSYSGKLDETSSAPKKQSSFTKDENEIPQFRMGLSKGENSKTIKGYFVTLPGEDGYKTSRRINNIKQFGATGKTWGSYGFKAIAANDYKGIDQETKDLLYKYNTLWEELSSYTDTLKEKLEDQNAYVQRYPQLDIFYMYIVEEVGKSDFKPGFYLVTSKSKNFMTKKREWIDTTKSGIEAAGVPATGFLSDIFDNSAKKNSMVSITWVLDKGYQFSIKSDPIKDPSKKIVLDENAINNLKPLSQAFLDETNVDKEGLKNAIKALTMMIDKCKSSANLEKAAASVAGGSGDVFND